MAQKTCGQVLAQSRNRYILNNMEDTETQVETTETEAVANDTQVEEVATPEVTEEAA